MGFEVLHLLLGVAMTLHHLPRYAETTCVIPNLFRCWDLKHPGVIPDDANGDERRHVPSTTDRPPCGGD